MAPAAERPVTALPAEGVPTVEALEARGATIGRIAVYIDNIFNLADPREDKGLYRLANRLHYTTRERVVRQQLLFASGEPLNVRRLAETERILRARRYLNDAWVVPVGYDAEHNVADVAVTVRDVWTLNPGVSVGRSGGSNRSRVEIEEQNLFGLGTKISVSRSHDVDRTSTLFSYYDGNLRGSWLQLGLDYADNSDGKVKALALNRPFYALDTRTAFGGAVYDGTSRISRYSRGAIVDQFEEQRTDYEAHYGWSRGLKDGWTQRWYAGVHYQDVAFARRADVLQQPAELPGNRRYAYPWLGWQLIEDRYVKTENLDLIGRTEDLYLGRSAYLELGYAAPAFGAKTSAWLARATTVAGWQPGARRYFFLNGNLDGRVAGGGVENLTATLGGRYFERLTDHQLFYAALSATTTRRLNAEQQLLLGGDSGLRGYPLRFQGGTASALLTLEHRVFTDWYPFRLLRIGGAAFFDAGRTWGRDLTGAVPLGLLKDVGVGIRFGNNRSGLGNVLHVDFSYALDAPPGVKRFEVNVETKQRF